MQDRQKNLRKYVKRQVFADTLNRYENIQTPERRKFKIIERDEDE